MKWSFDPILQIDGNFYMRKIQISVAAEMMSPSKGHNMVLQLNMGMLYLIATFFMAKNSSAGEGKSAVIAPCVAATLSDTSRLVRLVILKPLANQMFQLLVKSV